MSRIITKLAFCLIFCISFSSAEELSIPNIAQESNSSTLQINSLPNNKQTQKAYISFNPKLEDPSLNDPRIKSIISYVHISASTLEIGYFNSDNYRFANKLKDLLTRNNTQEVKLSEMSFVGKYNKNLVYVFWE